MATEPTGARATDGGDRGPGPAAWSRRRFLASVGAATVGTAALAAAARPAVAAKRDPYPRTVRGVNGPVRITARPRRVLIGDNGTVLADAVALGTVPVAYGRWFVFGDDPWPWIADAAPELADVPVLTTADPEAALAHRPDLVLLPAKELLLPGVEGLAPVVVAPADDWRARQTLVAAALDRAKRSRALLADVDAAIERTGRRLGARTELRLDWVSAYYSDGTRIYRHTASTPLAGLLTEIGFPPLVEASGDAYQELSLERAPDLLTGDALVVEDWSSAPNQEYGTDQLLANPLVQRSPAYQSGNIVRLSGDESIASFALSALGIPLVLDALLRLREPR